jgi:zinc/manganese transport system permease protein
MIVYDVLIRPFVDFEFMRRALVGTLALSLSAAPVGVFLLLRRMSLTGDCMAHAILPGAAIGYLFAGLSLTAMTIGGIIAGLAVAFGAGAVARTTVLKEDATLAAFYLLSLALGVTIVSVHGNNVECVDPQFLRSVSRAGGPVHFAFMGLVVINLVAGFHALGTLLAVGIMMLPAASARLWTTDLTSMIVLAVVAALVSGYAGLVMSYAEGLPSGPAIILAAGVIYALSLIFGRVSGLVWRFLPRAHLEA